MYYFFPWSKYQEPPEGSCFREKKQTERVGLITIQSRS